MDRGQATKFLVGQVTKFGPTHLLSSYFSIPFLGLFLESNFRVLSPKLKIHIEVVLWKSCDNRYGNYLELCCPIQ